MPSTRRWSRIVAVPFLVAMSMPATGDPPPPLSDEWQDHLLSDLAGAEDVEHLLVAAYLWQPDIPERAAATYRRARAIDPDNVLVMHETAWFCLEHPTFDLCSEGALDQLLALDPHNGVAWQLAAVHHYRDGDEQGAQALLRRASTAESIEDFRAATVGIFSRTLQAYRPLAPKAHYTAVMGYVSAIPSRYGSVLEVCRNRSDIPRWRALCYDYGRRVADDGLSIDAAMSGRFIQARALDGDGESAARAEAVREDARTLVRAYASLQPALEGMGPDDVYWLELLANMERLGERAAFERAVADLAVGGAGGSSAERDLRDGSANALADGAPPESLTPSAVARPASQSEGVERQDRLPFLLALASSLIVIVAIAWRRRRG